MSDFHRPSPKMAWLHLYAELQMNQMKPKTRVKFKLRVVFAVELSIYKGVHPNINECSFMGNSIGLKKVNP